MVNILKLGLLDRTTNNLIGFFAEALDAIEARDAIRPMIDAIVVYLAEDGTAAQNWQYDRFATKERYLASEKVGKVRPHLRGNPLPDGALLEALKAGLMPKEILIDGNYYYGHCRNASVARWDANGKASIRGSEDGPTGRFVHIRHKFGDTFPESINHPEDDNGHDFFIPVATIDPLDSERVSDEFLRQTR